jgi:hypothetical protein
MERALTECGYPPAEVNRIIGDLTSAFDRSQEEGQAQWKKTREAILRRRAAAVAWEKAEQVEAEAIKSFTERRKRGAPIVADWAEQRYSGR